MTALPRSGVQKHRRPAHHAMPYVRTAVLTAAIVTAVNRQAGRNTVDPAQTALRVAVRLDPAGRFAIKRPRHRAVRTRQSMLRGGLLQHLGMKPAMHEQRRSEPQPGRRLSNQAQRLRLEGIVHLLDRGLHHRLDPNMLAGQHARQFQVVIAEEKQPALAFNQIEHHAQRGGAVRAVIRQIPELHDEAVGGDGVCEAGGIAVHIANDSDLCIRGDRGCGHRTIIKIE